MTRIAVIADAHFHDIAFDPGAAGTPFPALRTLADSTASTRIFNESGPALVVALDAILARGIGIVVIVGDLTDDGQVFNWQAVNRVLDRYRARGLRFYATPGNHDLFAMSGEHHTKRFLRPDGSSQSVSSDPASGADIVTPRMFCPGYPEALPLMRDLGYAPGAADLYWETPFGTDPEWSSRLYQAMSPDGMTVLPMVDASYLVEPEDGLWLLSLDANIFRPNDAAAIAAGAPPVRDCTESGWNAALADKPHLLAWASDIAARARAQGKTLIVFSHYPVVDPLNGGSVTEQSLLGDTGFVRRMPAPAVAAAFAGSGIGVHFSGHWHINNTASHRDDSGQIVNISVPSLVAFPAAFKVVDASADAMRIETVSLQHMAGHDTAFAAYAAEARRADRDAGAILAAPDYAAFLTAHLLALVRHRYLPREWPADFARLVPLLTLDELHEFAQCPPVAAASIISTPPDDRPTLFDLVVDWYAIRKGADLALAAIAPERLASYRTLIAAYGKRNWPPGSVQVGVAALLVMLERYLARAPSRDFSIDKKSGMLA